MGSSLPLFDLSKLIGMKDSDAYTHILNQGFSYHIFSIDGIEVSVDRSRIDYDRISLSIEKGFVVEAKIG